VLGEGYEGKVKKANKISVTTCDMHTSIVLVIDHDGGRVSSMFRKGGCICYNT